jgi:hypothetical protein
MSFFDGKPRIANESALKGCWHSMKPGEGFRCNLCGYKFQLGDQYRIVYTNDNPETFGNPLVCAKCDTGDEDIKKEWAEMWRLAKTKFWWFIRPDEPEHYSKNPFE